MNVTDNSVDQALSVAEHARKANATVPKAPNGAPSEGYTHNGPGDDASIMVEDFGNVRPFTP